MEIKGSGDKYYDVNLEDLTCNCRDWSCRRHNFSKDDPRRLCKHLTEALKLLSAINDEPLIKINPIYASNESINRLSNLFRSLDIVLRYSISGEIYRKSHTITEYIPIIIELIDSYVPYSLVDKYLYDNGYVFSSMNNEGIRFYNGDMPIAVIESDLDNFLFRSLYYDIGKNEFIKLSSLLFKNTGLILTKNGMIDKNGNIIKSKIYTIDELNLFLGIT